MDAPCVPPNVSSEAELESNPQLESLPDCENSHAIRVDAVFPVNAIEKPSIPQLQLEHIQDSTGMDSSKSVLRVSSVDNAVCTSPPVSVIDTTSSAVIATTANGKRKQIDKGAKCKRGKK